MPITQAPDRDRLQRAIILQMRLKQAETVKGELSGFFVRQCIERILSQKSGDNLRDSLGIKPPKLTA
jgi:hypothetical protein